MALRVIIADDQEAMRKIMKKILSSLDYVEIVGESTTGLELIDMAMELNPDILFIDINIPGMNGIEAAKEIRKQNKKVSIVFATGYKDFKGDAFDVYATDYIEKPYDKERVIRTVERIRDIIDRDQEDADKFLDILCNRSRRLIRMDDILYIEASNRKLFIHTEDEEIGCNDTLNGINEQLDQRFMRTHKSFIINLDKIHNVKPLSRTSYSVYFEDSSKTACVSSELLDEMITKVENLTDRRKNEK